MKSDRYILPKDWYAYIKEEDKKKTNHKNFPFF